MTARSGTPHSLRPSWDEYFFTLVDAAATRATCDRGKSGCVFVRDNDVLTTGYVGAPPGLPHCDDVGHLWSADGKHCVRTVHAEQNAILRAARNGNVLKDATVYTTMAPCQTCAMMLIGIGVSQVIAKNGYHGQGPGVVMLEQVSIPLRILNQSFIYE